MMAIQELVVPRSMPMTLAMWSHSFLRRSGAALSAKHRAGPLFHTVAGYVSGRRPSRNGCGRSEEHTSELQSLMRISYAVFCLKKKIKTNINNNINIQQPK